MYEQQQLQALIQTAVDGILSITHDGRIQLFNPASERLFGWRADEVMGRNVSMLMPPHYAHQHDLFIKNYLDTGTAKIIGIGRKVEGLRKDGSTFPMSLSVGEYAETGGQRHFVGIVRDSTNEVAEQERVQGLQRQLELIGRHSAVTEMGAALAHELNQPLTAIDLFLAAAERALDTDPEKARHLFDRVRQEAARAGGIVKRIRQMVERGDGEPAFFKLNDSITHAVELCRVVERQGKAIHIAPVEEITLFGDEIQIHQILVNLIKNALDATQGNSERQIDIITSQTPTDIAVDVVDNGPGVDVNFQDKLFDSFSSTKKEGLGIGLSICRNIAENHGGSLTYVPPTDHTHPLKGACFRLRLPHAE